MIVAFICLTLGPMSCGGYVTIPEEAEAPEPALRDAAHRQIGHDRSVLV